MTPLRLTKLTRLLNIYLRKEARFQPGVMLEIRRSGVVFFGGGYMELNLGHKSGSERSVSTNPVKADYLKQ